VREIITTSNTSQLIQTFYGFSELSFRSVLCHVHF